jgi:hypothetical protein
MQARLPKVVIALLAGIIAISVGSGIQAQAPYRLVGTWKLNVAKSKFSPGPPPTSLVVTYSASGDSLKIVVDVAWEGEKQHWEMTGKNDGKDNPITGNPGADTASFRRIDEFNGESTFKKDGKVTATNTRVMSKDGKTLTITSKGTTPDGKPRNDVQVFEKSSATS